MDVPPVLINGRGCPVTGNKCTATPIFIKAWKTIGNPTASDSNWPKILLDLYEMITILNSNIIYNSNIIIATIRPYSSVIIEKICEIDSVS